MNVNVEGLPLTLTDFKIHLDLGKIKTIWLKGNITVTGASIEKYPVILLPIVFRFVKGYTFL